MMRFSHVKKYGKMETTWKLPISKLELLRIICSALVHAKTGDLRITLSTNNCVTADKHRYVLQSHRFWWHRLMQRGRRGFVQLPTDIQDKDNYRKTAWIRENLNQKTGLRPRRTEKYIFRHVTKCTRVANTLRLFGMPF